MGPRALVGHLAMLSTGTVLEEGAEVGVGCAVGSKVRFRKNAFIGACCAVGHLVEFGEGCDVGYMSSIGIAARIGPGVKLPQVTLVPNRVNVSDQADADALLSSAVSPMKRLAARLAAHAPQPAPVEAVEAERWNRFE